MTYNPLWDVIQAYMDDPAHRYAPKVADIARETGVSDQLLSKWKKQAVLPKAAHLLRVAKGTGISYERLLRAALEGQNYLPPGSRIILPARLDDLLAGGERPAVVVTDEGAGPLTPERRPQSAGDQRP